VSFVLFFSSKSLRW